MVENENALRRFMQRALPHRRLLDALTCPGCISKDAEIERLQQARDTALEALERERCARRGTATE